MELACTTLICVAGATGRPNDFVTAVWGSKAQCDHLCYQALAAFPLLWGCRLRHHCRRYCFVHHQHLYRLPGSAPQTLCQHRRVLAAAQRSYPAWRAHPVATYCQTRCRCMTHQNRAQRAAAKAVVVFEAVVVVIESWMPEPRTPPPHPSTNLATVWYVGVIESWKREPRMPPPHPSTNLATVWYVGVIESWKQEPCVCWWTSCVRRRSHWACDQPSAQTHKNTKSIELYRA